MYKANPDTPNTYGIPSNAHHHPPAYCEGSAFGTCDPTFDYPIDATRGGRHTHDVGPGKPWAGRCRVCPRHNTNLRVRFRGKVRSRGNATLSVRCGHDVLQRRAGVSLRL